MKPEINRQKMKPIKVHAGQTIKYDVDVKGEPAPTLTWFFKNAELRATPPYQIENEEYNTKLNILNSTRAESGTYRLKAENINGVDEVEVEITVLDLSLIHI